MPNEWASHLANSVAPSQATLEKKTKLKEVLVFPWKHTHSVLIQLATPIYIFPFHPPRMFDA